MLYILEIRYATENEKGKRETIKRIELPNQEKIITFKEKEN